VPLILLGVVGFFIFLAMLRITKTLAPPGDIEEPEDPDERIAYYWCKWLWWSNIYVYEHLPDGYYGYFSYYLRRSEDRKGFVIYEERRNASDWDLYAEGTSWQEVASKLQSFRRFKHTPADYLDRINVLIQDQRDYADFGRVSFNRVKLEQLIKRRKELQPYLQVLQDQPRPTVWEEHL